MAARLESGLARTWRGHARHLHPPLPRGRPVSAGARLESCKRREVHRQPPLRPAQSWFRPESRRPRPRALVRPSLKLRRCRTWSGGGVESARGGATLSSALKGTKAWEGLRHPSRGGVSTPIDRERQLTPYKRYMVDCAINIVQIVWLYKICLRL